VIYDSTNDAAHGQQQATVIQYPKCSKNMNPVALHSNGCEHRPLLLTVCCSTCSGQNLYLIYLTVQSCDAQSCNFSAPDIYTVAHKYVTVHFVIITVKKLVGFLNNFCTVVSRKNMFTREQHVHLT